MTVRFTSGIASDAWSYAPDQVVTLGKVWSADEIPAEIGRAWLSSGIVVADTPEKPTVAKKKGAK